MTAKNKIKMNLKAGEDALGASYLADDGRRPEGTCGEFEVRVSFVDSLNSGVKVDRYKKLMIEILLMTASRVYYLCIDYL